MSEFDFTLLLSGITDFTDEQVDALFEAGCDDATVAQRHGRVYVTFSREAESLTQAVVRAIADIDRAEIGASVLRIDEAGLVTKAEIARRIERSRQLVGQYIAGERGPGGFPPPACNVAQRQPMWNWCEVAYWLSQNDLIQPELNREAQEIATLNGILELRHLQQIAPEVTQPLLKGLPLFDPTSDASSG